MQFWEKLAAVDAEGYNFENKIFLTTRYFPLYFWIPKVHFKPKKNWFFQNSTQVCSMSSMAMIKSRKLFIFMCKNCQWRCFVICKFSGASAGDDDTEDELEYGGDSRATTLPRGMQAAAANTASAATNSLPRLPASTGPGTGTAATSTTPMHKAHSVYHFLPQHTGVKSARYRPPGFARNSLGNAGGTGGPKRAVSAPGLQVSGTQVSSGKRETSRSRRQQAISLTPGKFFIN